MSLKFDLSPTQSAFVHSAANVVILRGPMGEGKTFAGAAGVIRHAIRCGKTIRGALIRDTHTNIETFTIPSLKEILGGYATFHQDNHLMRIDCHPKVELDLFGIDSPGALSKLQGPEYSLIWIEEPAPIIEKANAGISRDVFDMAVARAARQSGTVMRVQLTQNPADEDHWSEEVAQGPTVMAEKDGVRIIKEVFDIKYGENKYLNEMARVANEAAFGHDEGKRARYIEGRAAPVQMGKKVAAEYSASIHFSPMEIPVVRGGVGIRGWDGWHHPACGICQLVPPGRLIVHDVVVGDGVGVAQLIKQKIQPLLNSPKYKGKIQDWRDIGDPSMRTPDQGSIARSAARRIKDAFNTRFEPGPTRWENRIAPLNTALTEIVGGEPKIKISRSAYGLHRALNGGWHFKIDNSGNIVGSLPVKDMASNLGDMISYVVSVLFPYVRATRKAQREVAKKEERMKRAASYA